MYSEVGGENGMGGYTVIPSGPFLSKIFHVFTKEGKYFLSLPTSILSKFKLFSRFQSWSLII